MALPEGFIILLFYGELFPEGLRDAGGGSLPERGQPLPKVAPREEVEKWVEAAVGSGQGERHHHRLLEVHGVLAAGALQPQHVEVHGPQDVVRGEADQEGGCHDDDHPDGLLAVGLVLLQGIFHQGPYDHGVADGYDNKGKNETQKEGNKIQDHNQLCLGRVFWGFEALGLVAMLIGPILQERSACQGNKNPDADAHKFRLFLRDQIDVLHWKNDGYAAEEAHCSHEENAAVQVDVQGVGTDPAEEVTEEPVPLVDVVDHAQGQGAHAEEVGHGEVEHVHLEGRLLPVRPYEDVEHHAVADEAHDADHGVERGVHAVSEVINGVMARQVVEELGHLYGGRNWLAGDEFQAYR